MKKLLLTGFEPFLDYTVNPTQKIIEELNGKKINEYEVVGKVMVVDFQKSGQQLLDYIETENPDAVISLGLAAGRYKVTPERIAINCNDGDRDNNGHQPSGERIKEEGPDGLFSTLPIRKFTDELNKKGYPAEVSNTAGTYLCNHVMYQGIHYFYEKNQNKPSGFIHIPASHELAIQHGKLPSWSYEDLVTAVEIMIEQLG